MLNVISSTCVIKHIADRIYVRFGKVFASDIEKLV